LSEFLIRGFLENVNYKSDNQLYNSDSLIRENLFDKRIWRVDDVAKFLKCTVGHVYNLASDDRIPRRKKNGLLFFVPNEILDWILEGN